MKKVKLFVSTLLAIFLLFSCTGCVNVKISKNYNLYWIHLASVGNANEYMPINSTLGEYEDLRYSYSSFTEYIFCAETMALFVQYDEENYAIEKENMLNRYTFIEEPIRDSYDNDYIMPVTELDYKGYHFKICINENYPQSACQSFLMAGFDDENLRLAYCYFYDSDLDVIAFADENPETEMKTFLNRYFYWNNFR